MCDTFVAVGNATRDGAVIFGKNSDRDPNEAHQLLMIPRTKHQAGAKVRCTYIDLPQVLETNAVLLSKPFWMWGAEMGANEHGLVIGNEAVFTKVPYEKNPGLLGMDFLRLALERTATADEALDLMIELLETYGQGGNCGFSKKFFYHNGFLIADRQGAWVFETAGKHWAAERVKDVRSISNVISIGADWDRCSDHLESYALEKGWCKDADEFNFSRCYSDLIFTKFGAGRERQCTTEEQLMKHRGRIDVRVAMNLLRNHGEKSDNAWVPGKGVMGADVCMHASFGMIRGSQTTGSMVSHLAHGQDTHWMTGTSAPCTSIFKPVWIESGLPDLGPEPTGTYDEATLWWRHENLHREVLRDYATRIQEISPARDSIEAEFIAQIPEIINQPIETKQAFTKECFGLADKAVSEWLTAIMEKPVQNARPLLDRIAWKNFDKTAKRHP